MEENIENLANIEVDKDNLAVYSNKNIYCESYYFIDILNESAYRKFIKNTKKIIRASKAYRRYTEMLLDNYTALTHDIILSNITSANAKIEFHHYPLSLDDIVDIVASYHIMKKEKVTSFSVAQEIMELHYKNNIGLVPLTTMNHQLAHGGSLFISEKQIFGNWKAFVEKYDSAISSNLRAKLNKLSQMTEDDVASDFKGLF